MLLMRRSAFLAVSQFVQPHGDQFRDIKDRYVLALGVARGVAKHDGAVGARHRNGGCLCLRKLGEPPLVDPLFAFLAPVLGDKKLRTPGPAAERVFAMVLRFGKRDSASD